MILVRNIEHNINTKSDNMDISMLFRYLFQFLEDEILFRKYSLKSTLISYRSVFRITASSNQDISLVGELLD